MPNWKKVIVSGSDASLNTLSVLNGITGSLFGTASFATSASWAPLTPVFPFTGSAEITGSLTLTGSLLVNGTASISNTVTAPTFTDNVNFRLSNTGVIVLNSFINANAAYRFTSNSGNIASGQLFAQADVSQNNIIYTGDTHLRIVGRGSGLVALTAFNSTGNVTIGSLSDLGAKLNVQSTGSTSSTTAFLIQNSTPASILTVRDDGRIAFGSSGTGNTPLLYNSGNEGSSIDVSSRKLAFVSQDGNPGSNFSFILNNPAGITTGTLNNIVSRASITLSSGNTILNQYLINPTLALSSTYSGTVRGIFYNPTISSLTAGTHRAIETTSGDILFRSGSNNLLFVSQSGNVGIGTTTPSASLHISGTLLVDNSLLINKTSSSLASGTRTLDSSLTGSYSSAFYNYTISSGSNARAGQFIVVWNGGSVQYTDVSTLDIGSTSAIALTASLSGANLNVTTVLPSDSWTIKTLTNFL
jgi:hypothetical protein